MTRLNSKITSSAKRNRRTWDQVRLPHAKGMLVHRVDDIFALEDGPNRNRNDQGRGVANGLEKSPSVLQFIAAYPLGFERQRKIAHQHRDETHGKIKGITNIIRESQATKRPPQTLGHLAHHLSTWRAIGASGVQE